MRARACARTCVSVCVSVRTCVYCSHREHASGIRCFSSMHNYSIGLNLSMAFDSHTHPQYSAKLALNCSLECTKHVTTRSQAIVWDAAELQSNTNKN